MSTKRLRLELFADYFQFYLQDDDINAGDLSDIWTPEAMEIRIALAPRFVGITTARNMVVPVEVVVQDTPPVDDLDAWDHVAEASLDIFTGRIVVAGCTDYFWTAVRIEVAPGTYAIRAYFAGLGTLDATGIEGSDRYTVVLWPNGPRERRVLKRYKHETA